LESPSNRHIGAGDPALDVERQNSGQTDCADGAEEGMKRLLVCSYAMRGLDPCYRSGGTLCLPCRVRALDEDDMRKRLEAK